MKLGVMANNVSCTHAILNGKKLKEGSIVQMRRATNLPDDSPFKWFVAPLNDEWGDDSLAVYEGDVIELLEG